MRSFRHFLCLLLAFLLLLGGASLVSADVSTDPDAPNGMTVALPDAAPAPRRAGSGTPFVYYTLSGNGQLIENYYDGTGALRYACGNVTELYSDTSWPAQVSPYPVSNGFGFVMLEMDETGSTCAVRTLLPDPGATSLAVSISYDAEGRKVFYLPEDITTYADGSAVGRPAMTETVYYALQEDHRPVNIQRFSEDRLIFLGEYYYDDVTADARLIFAWEAQYDLQGTLESSCSYSLYYEDGVLSTVDAYFESSEPVLQHRTYAYADGMLREIRIATEDSAADERYRYEYDDRAQLTAIEHSVDGVVTDSMDLVYDGNGRLAQFLSYTYFDGSQGVRTGRPRIDARYLYDEKGFLTVMEYDTWTREDTMDADMKVFTFERNGDGSLRTLKQSNPVDGTTIAVDVTREYGTDDVPLVEDNVPIVEDCGFVTLTFPAHWRGKYLVETPDVGVVSVYNKANREAGYGGHLFTVYATTRVHSNMQLLDFSIDRNFQYENYSGKVGCYYLSEWDRGVIFALTDGNYSFSHTDAALAQDYLQMFRDVTSVLYSARLNEGELKNVADYLEMLEREHPEYPGYPTGWVEPPALPEGVNGY